MDISSIRAASSVLFSRKRWFSISNLSFSASTAASCVVAAFSLDMADLSTLAYFLGLSRLAALVVSDPGEAPKCNGCGALSSVRSGCGENIDLNNRSR